MASCLTDEHGQVRGVEDVFAAGDGTDFPIKQGGLGTQQADACAEMIASRAGASVEPQPFRPVLRGKLITKSESLNLSADISGGGGASAASPDILWWPSQKIAGRYLSPFLSGTKNGFEPEASDRALEIEVSLPTEWHGQPVGWDSKIGQANESIHQPTCEVDPALAGPPAPQFPPPPDLGHGAP